MMVIELAYSRCYFVHKGAITQICFNEHLFHILYQFHFKVSAKAKVRQKQYLLSDFFIFYKNIHLFITYSICSTIRYFASTFFKLKHLCQHFYLILCELLMRTFLCGLDLFQRWGLYLLNGGKPHASVLRIGKSSMNTVSEASFFLQIIPFSIHLFILWINIKCHDF